MCFGSKPKNPPGSYISAMNAQPVHIVPDDLLDNFQSLSIQDDGPPKAPIVKTSQRLSSPQPSSIQDRPLPDSWSTQAPQSPASTQYFSSYDQPFPKTQTVKTTQRLPSPQPSFIQDRPLPSSWSTQATQSPASTQYFSPYAEPFPRAQPIKVSQNIPSTVRARIPQFPMSHHPQCRRCKWIPKIECTVNDRNPNGNSGRRYFICIKCKPKRDATSPRPRYEKTWTSWRARRDREGWISWNDYVGIDEVNRPCFCPGGFACRQDRCGWDSPSRGQGFWTCATGQCDFLSFRKDGQPCGSPVDEYWEPWLLGPWSFD